MTARERYIRYEAEKNELRRIGLSSAEYEKRLKELARKWRI